MSYFQFDYDKFYNYYTKDSNVKTKEDDKNSLPKTIWFYRNSNSDEPESDILSNKYININGIDIFISKSKEHNNKSELFFTIPKEIDNKLWDIHFHFGKDIIIPPNKKNRSNINGGKVPIVFFHKTIQNPELKGKERKNCYYQQNMKIDNVGKILCLQSTSSKMDDIFPPDTKDFHLIKEIISKPFHVYNPGRQNTKMSKTRNTSKTRNKHKGGKIQTRRKHIK